MKSGWALIFVVALAFRALEAATFTNCITNPTNMDRDNVVEESGILSLSCSTDSTVASCIWRHTDPISEQNQGTSAEPTIMCSGSPETTGRQCTDDTRVTYRTSTSTCAIDVTLPKPEDTGKWYLSAVTFKGSSNQQVLYLRNIATGVTQPLSPLFCALEKQKCASKYPTGQYFSNQFVIEDKTKYILQAPERG